MPGIKNDKMIQNIQDFMKDIETPEGRNKSISNLFKRKIKKGSYYKRKNMGTPQVRRTAQSRINTRRNPLPETKERNNSAFNIITSSGVGSRRGESHFKSERKDIIASNFKTFQQRAKKITSRGNKTHSKGFEGIKNRGMFSKKSFVKGRGRIKRNKEPEKPDFSFDTSMTKNQKDSLNDDYGSQYYSKIYSSTSKKKIRNIRANSTLLSYKKSHPNPPKTTLNTKSHLNLKTSPFYPIIASPAIHPLALQRPSALKQKRSLQSSSHSVLRKSLNSQKKIYNNSPIKAELNQTLTKFGTTLGKTTTTFSRIKNGRSFKPKKRRIRHSVAIDEIEDLAYRF